MSTKQKAVPGTKLSAQMTKLWGDVPARYYVTATSDYIVFIDQAMNVEWKSTTQWDKRQLKNRSKFATVLNRAAEIESAQRDGSDDQRAFNLKRQIGEAIERGLAGDFKNAESMLDKAEAYRAAMVAQRRDAIQDFVAIKGLEKLLPALDSHPLCDRRHGLADFKPGCLQARVARREQARVLRLAGRGADRAADVPVPGQEGGKIRSRLVHAQ